MNPEPKEVMETRLRDLLRSASSREEGIRLAVEIIRASSPKYHWTGVYLLNDSELVLAHEIGRPTPHRRIPLDKGICGAAAREGATLIVDDVSSDSRYLACNLETRSEIVVPLKGDDGRVLGEIDIDSDLRAAFGDGDRERLEIAAAILSGFLENAPPGRRPPDRPLGRRPGPRLEGSS
jgi:GAF domain-containing protein